MNSKKALSSLKLFLESQEEQYDSQISNADLYLAIETIETSLVGAGSDSIFASDRPNDCEKRCREIIKNRSLSTAFPSGVFTCFKRNWQVLIVFLKKKPWKNSESDVVEDDGIDGLKNEAKSANNHELGKRDGETDAIKTDDLVISADRVKRTIGQPIEEMKINDAREKSLSVLWEKANSNIQALGQGDKPRFIESPSPIEITPVVVDICNNQVYFRTKDVDGNIIDSPSYYFDDKAKKILPEDSKGFYGTQTSYSLFSSLFFNKDNPKRDDCVRFLHFILDGCFKTFPHPATNFALLPDNIDDFESGIRRGIFASGINLFILPRSMAAVFYSVRHNSLPIGTTLILDLDSSAPYCTEILNEAVKTGPTPHITRFGYYSFDNGVKSYPQIAEIYIKAFEKAKGIVIDENSREQIIVRRLVEKVINLHEDFPLLQENGSFINFEFEASAASICKKEISDAAIKAVAVMKSKMPNANIILVSSLLDAALNAEKMSSGAMEIYSRYETGKPLWDEDIPSLTIEVVDEKGETVDRELMHCKPKNIFESLGAAEWFDVPGVVVLETPHREKEISLPISRTSSRRVSSQDREACFTDPAYFPLNGKIKAKLRISYQFGAVDPYHLIAIPFEGQDAPFSQLINVWRDKSPLKPKAPIVDQIVPKSANDDWAIARATEKFNQLASSLTRLHPTAISYEDMDAFNHKMHYHFMNCFNGDNRDNLDDFVNDDLPDIIQTMKKAKSLISKDVYQQFVEIIGTMSFICDSDDYSDEDLATSVANIVLKDGTSRDVFSFSRNIKYIDDPIAKKVMKELCNRVNANNKGDEIYRDFASVCWYEKEWVNALFATPDGPSTIEKIAKQTIDRLLSISAAEISTNASKLRDPLEGLYGLLRLWEECPQMLDPNSDSAKTLIKRIEGFDTYIKKEKCYSITPPLASDPNKKRLYYSRLQFDAKPLTLNYPIFDSLKRTISCKDIVHLRFVPE
jgi:hypothetical protein